MKQTEKIHIEFDDASHCHYIACCKKRLRRIIFCDCYLSINLDNKEFVDATIKHECIHLLEANHGAMFHYYCKVYGVAPSRIIQVAHNSPVKNNRLYANCPNCGYEINVSKKGLTMAKKKYTSFNYKCPKCNTIIAEYKKGVDY
jgi:predicted RNA-binding Zn-ribbon protein involved in translation (DUF1610 family)